MLFTIKEFITFFEAVQPSVITHSVKSTVLYFPSQLFIQHPFYFMENMYYMCVSACMRVCVCECVCNIYVNHTC